MIEVRIQIRNQAALAALGSYPGVLERHVGQEVEGLARWAAGRMKMILGANRSAASSDLIESINSEQLGPMHYFVGPHVAYGREVEEGTGPAAGRPSYMPNPVHLRAYVKQGGGGNPAGRILLKGRPGSARRRQVMDEIRDKAWALAIYIKRHGTRPHPYIAPTAAELEARAPGRIEAAVERATREAFGA